MKLKGSRRRGRGRKIWRHRERERGRERDKPLKYETAAHLSFNHKYVDNGLLSLTEEALDSHYQRRRLLTASVLYTTTSRVPALPTIWKRALWICTRHAFKSRLIPYWRSGIRCGEKILDPFLTQDGTGPGLHPAIKASLPQRSRTVTPCGFSQIIQMQHDVTLSCTQLLHTF